MSLGHFQYLLSDTQNDMTKVSSDRLELLASSAAKQYIDSGTSLNALISKVAQENDLNHHQVARVCEMANIATHKFLWSKTAQKESVAFPLADARQIVAVSPRIGTEGASCDMPATMPSPCDGASADYMGPPPNLPSEKPGLLSMLGIGAKGHDGLHAEPERKQIIIIMQKKAAERASLRSKVVYAGMELEDLEKRACDAVKQAVIRGESFEQIYQAAHLAGLAKTAAHIIGKFNGMVVRDSDGKLRYGMSKIAIAKAPEDLISDNLGNVTVINGAHPVIVYLDTVAKKTGEIKNGLHNLLRIDDELNTYNQRIREL